MRERARATCPTRRETASSGKRRSFWEICRFVELEEFNRAHLYLSYIFLLQQESTYYKCGFAAVGLHVRSPCPSSREEERLPCLATERATDRKGEGLNFSSSLPRLLSFLSMHSIGAAFPAPASGLKMTARHFWTCCGGRRER